MTKDPVLNSDETGGAAMTVTTPTTPSPLKATTANTEYDTDVTLTPEKSAPSLVTVRCQCPPPLSLPEIVKREMKREEEEHRQRECGLYAKIIELQIEVANLKGENESLTRVVGRRDKMLLELQVQLQAMEFVCRENDIKVDIDMCPDEVIENWSFKESDEVYQRIVLITQDLLRNGAKCVEDGMASIRSYSNRRNSSTSSAACSSSIKNVAVAGLSEGAQPLPVQDVNPLLFKETSRPGTLQFNPQTLLRSEQEFKQKNTNNNSLSAVESGPRRALDIGTDRSNLFRGHGENNGSHEADVDDDGDDNDDEDDDEGQESEFEELGEDMIKYVELQASMTPRRDSRSASFSKPGIVPSSTPDMSTAVLMKNMWNSSKGNTRPAMPLHHTTPQNGGGFSPSFRNQAKTFNRGSSSSSLSSNSMQEDYLSRPQSFEQPIGLGLGIGIGSTGYTGKANGTIRSPEMLFTDRFAHPELNYLLSAPPTRPLPPSPSPNVNVHPVSRHPLSNPSTPGPYSDHNMGASAAAIARSATAFGTCAATMPPPMIPLPPLPAGQPRYSYRDHTKCKLLEKRRPAHGRTCSHGFVIEHVGQFQKRKTYGKTLIRDTMYHGHHRRGSV
ncbi:hypothetical protein BGZ94_009841 [Podila epigama]|nr:hypothetical protein BGZ94_009841 [Podila epigama]